MSIMIPQQIKLNQTKSSLILDYAEESFGLSAEFLRVHSPSAEVQGHGLPILQTGKKNVLITDLEIIGNYALKISYSDKHSSGLYHWDYLYHLATNYATIWQQYLNLLTQSNQSRD